MPSYADLVAADLSGHALDDMTVAGTIEAFPCTAPVFNAYGLDLRRGRAVTLSRAAADAGMTLERLVTELRYRLPEPAAEPVGTR